MCLFFEYVAQKLNYNQVITKARMHSEKNRFEITVDGCVVEFVEHVATDEPNHRDIIIESIVYMPNEGVNNRFDSLSEEDGTGQYLIGSLTLNQMPTFAEFKDHILCAVPEAAREKNIEPFQISDIRPDDGSHRDEREVVILSIISTNKCEAFDIRMYRDATVDVIRSLRTLVQKLTRQISAQQTDKK